MSQRSQHPMTLTQFTQTGAALTQLGIQGYVDIETARLLIAEKLAAPARIRVEMRNFPCKGFEGIALTLEGHKTERPSAYRDRSTRPALRAESLGAS
jgi:hypothetical protein